MKNKNLFWGLFFIIAAGLIVVNQLGYLAGITTLNLVITIFMIPIILKSIIKINFFGILFPLAILGILFSNELGIGTFVPIHILLVALFLSVGLSLIFGRYNKCVEKWKNICIHDNHEHFGEVINTEDDDIVNFGVTLGSSIKYVNAKNLKQANFSCSFGALKVYLDNSTISPEGAVINVDISFSAIEMYIPKEWKVLNGIASTVSGIEEKYKRHAEETASIRLVGKANFSGIQIIYV